MKTLKDQYGKNGYLHKLIWRDEVYAITEVSDQDSGKVYCYESFEIIRYPSKTTGQITYEGFESCPSNEQWGSKGLTANSLQDAFNKIQKLKTKKDGRQTKTTSNH